MTNKLWIIILLLFAASCFAQNQPLLQITSPSSGSVVFPGQTIVIFVNSDPSISDIAIIGQDPLGFSQITNGNPLQFVLTIPANAPIDQYQVSALGQGADGSDVASSPITLFVDTRGFPFKVRTQPEVLRFRATGESMPLKVIGFFGDGSQRDVTHSPRTSYFASDTTVATVDNRGIVTSVGPGSTFINVTMSGTSVSVNTKVPRNIDTTPPVTVATLSQQANAAGWNNSNVMMQFVSTDNEPGGTGVQSISVTLTGAQTGQNVFSGGTASVTISAEGTTTVSYFGTDNAGNSENPKTLTIKLDKTPPTITGMPAAGCSLWPPNHMLVQVATVSAADSLSGLATFVVTGVSSEPDDSDGPDVVISGSAPGPQTIQLRAERLGSGTGRVYTITANASDVAGNVVTQSATCVVPHDQGN